MAEQMLHIRYDGISSDYSLADLDIGSLSTDEDVKNAAARRLDIPVEKLRNFVVERHETGNWTIRPQAVFG